MEFRDDRFDCHPAEHLIRTINVVPGEFGKINF